MNDVVQVFSIFFFRSFLSSQLHNGGAVGTYGYEHEHGTWALGVPGNGRYPFWHLDGRRKTGRLKAGIFQMLGVYSVLLSISRTF